MKKATKKKLLSLLPALTVIAVLGVLGLGLGLYAYNGGSPKVVVEGDYIEAPEPVVEPMVGAFPGTDVYDAINFHAGFAKSVLATSTSGSAATMLESELASSEIFEMMVIAQNTTWTLPATSTLSGILPNPGDSKTWLIRSMTTSGSAAVLPTLTVAAGTGWELLGIDANVDVILPNETLQMDCFRAAASSTNSKSLDIVCGMQEFVDVD